MAKSRKPKDKGKELFRIHHLHTGVYRRVAERLGVDASLVSRVAKGVRNNEVVRKALVETLSQIR
jgi:hypothetical protein